MAVGEQKLTERNAVTSATSDDYIHVVQGGQSYKIKKSDFDQTAILPFVVIDNALIQKYTGNVDYTSIEANDRVFFKDVDSDGETVTLIGHTYNSGLTTLRASYTQNTIIEI